MEQFGYLPQEIADMSIEQQMIPMTGSTGDMIPCSSLSEARQLLEMLRGGNV